MVGQAVDTAASEEAKRTVQDLNLEQSPGPQLASAQGPGRIFARRVSSLAFSELHTTLPINPEMTEEARSGKMLSCAH